MSETFWRNLFLAAPMLRGEDVLAAQQALSTRQIAGVAQDGIFGPGTAAAVRAFQAGVALRQDGIIGRATWAALVGEAGRPASQPSQTAKTAYDYLTGTAGWTAEQACGIVANIKHESDFEPTRTGDAGLACGLAQWHPDRQRNFVAQNGKPIPQSSFTEQLAFIHYELTSGAEQPAGQRLRAAATAEQAGQIVSQYYERPRAVQAEAAARGQTAQSYFNAWNPAAAAPLSAPAASALPALDVFDVLAPRMLKTLQSDHARYPGGQTWRLAASGVVTGSFVPPDPAAITRIDALRQKYSNALASVLTRVQVPLELVLAFLDIFTGQAGATYRLGADLEFPERTPDRVAAGILQAPLHLARQALRDPDLGLASLADPETALAAGAQTIWLQGGETSFDPPLVAAAYTAGGLFLDTANPWKLCQGSAGIIDRFIAAFNAATASLTGTPPPVGIASLLALRNSDYLG